VSVVAVRVMQLSTLFCGSTLVGEGSATFADRWVSRGQHKGSLWSLISVC
jgi:hypothetical protein